MQNSKQIYDYRSLFEICKKALNDTQGRHDYQDLIEMVSPEKNKSEKVPVTTKG